MKRNKLFRSVVLMGIGFSLFQVPLVWACETEKQDEEKGAKIS